MPRKAVSKVRREKSLSSQPRFLPHSAIERISIDPLRSNNSETLKMSSSLHPSSSFRLLDAGEKLGFLHSRCFSLSVNAKSAHDFRLLRIRASGFPVCALVGNVGSSWLPSDGGGSDGLGGWLINETPSNDANKASTSISFLGAGVSLAVFLAAVSCWSISGKGRRIQLCVPQQVLDRLFRSSNSTQFEPVDIAKPDPPDVNHVEDRNIIKKTGCVEHDDEMLKHVIASEEKHEVLIISVPPDATQQEALSVLKKLKIIEDDVNSTQLCTRREYARWLVKANSFLERNPQHRIASSLHSCYPSTNAFQDVDVDDPDFLYIQALAESGVVLSHLSGSKMGPSNNRSDENKKAISFCPESFVSRLDLISWKSKLEYTFSPEEKMSRRKVNFVDIVSLQQDKLQDLILDMQAADKSIARKVFGHSKRFQPNKPVTKAQAAVAVASGRISEAIQAELSRLESKRLSREAELQEIKSELMLKGDIPRFWEENKSAEKAQGARVQKHLTEVMVALQEEKKNREESCLEFLKEQAALDCQEKLLVNLKVEVDDMCKILATEKEKVPTEKRYLEEQFAEYHAKKEATIEAKSVLEAEIEAIRIFRNWVEDEARRNQSRAKILEEALRRWTGDGPHQYNGSTTKNDTA